MLLKISNIPCSARESNNFVADVFVMGFTVIVGGLSKKFTLLCCCVFTETFRLFAFGLVPFVCSRPFSLLYIISKQAEISSFDEQIS